MRYSIIYALTRPLAQEIVSVGIVFFKDGDFEYIYSEKKLRIAESLISSCCAPYLSSIVKDFQKNVLEDRSDESIARELGYLSRYSNNIILVTEPRTISMDFCRESFDTLYSQYVE